MIAAKADLEMIFSMEVLWHQVGSNFADFPKWFWQLYTGFGSEMCGLVTPSNYGHVGMPSVATFKRLGANLCSVIVAFQFEFPDFEKRTNMQTMYFAKFVPMRCVDGSQTDEVYGNVVGALGFDKRNSSAPWIWNAP